MKNYVFKFLALLVLTLAACSPPPASTTPSTEATPASDKQLPIYAPDQHELYDGRFNIVGRKIYQVGILDDPSPWNHMGDDASNVRSVGGEIAFQANELDNTATFVATLDLPEGKYVVELDRVHEFNSCQDGGIAAYLYEHGDSGCGDANWPKSLLYIAGWGYGHATLNGETLYDDYQIHFMVTQGMRDRETLQVRLSPDMGPAGSINPAAQQLDFYIRSPEANDANHPGREVFDHFFAMEVTWR